MPNSNIANGHRRIYCEIAGCNKYARGSTMQRCKAHGGGPRCLHPGCFTSAQDATMRCIKHGGGPRCEHTSGCDKAAQGSTRRCVKHGGGKPCLHPGGCNKFARVGTKRCVAHGGGQRCTHAGCSKGAHASLKFCVAHSGSNRLALGAVVQQRLHGDCMPEQPDLWYCQSIADSSSASASASGEARSLPSSLRPRRACRNRSCPGAETDTQEWLDDHSQEEEGMQLCAELLRANPWTSEPSSRRSLACQSRSESGVRIPHNLAATGSEALLGRLGVSRSDGCSEAACTSMQAVTSGITHTGVKAETRSNGDGTARYNAVYVAGHEDSPPKPMTAELEEDQCCFGNCFAGAGTFTFSGEPCGRPNRMEPEGGWGFTTCCNQPAHFDCLYRWLSSHKTKNANTISGEMLPKPRCPFCRRYLPHSSTRMLKARTSRVEL